MDILSRLALFTAALLLLGAAPVFAQTNYTTNITASKINAAGGPVPYATVCAYAADIQGNPINIAAPTWGLILKGTAVGCEPVVAGALTPLPVPDASHTDATGPIYYNLTIQQTNSSGTPTSQSIFLPAVGGITGTAWPLDAYAPAANVPVTPSSALTQQTSAPSSCTGPSIYLPSSSSSTPAVPEFCQNGVYVPFPSSGSGSAASFSAYSNTTPYSAGNVVLYTNNIGYIATQSTTGNLPTNTTYWTPLWAAASEPIGAAAATAAAAAQTTANTANTAAANAQITGNGAVATLGGNALSGVRYANGASPDTVATSAQMQNAIGTGIYAAFGAPTAAVQALFGSATPLSGQAPVYNAGAGKYVPTTLTPGSIGASVAPSFPVTPLANYELAGGGSGTTVADTTGNGNTLTFGTSTRQPTWAANGISFAFGQGADFPTTLTSNAPMTWCGYGNFSPLLLTGFAQGGGDPTLIASSLASNAAGSSILLSYLGQFLPNGLGASPGLGIDALDGYTNAIKTSTNQTFSGEVSFCVVWGQSSNSTTDTIYFSNAPITYNVHGATGGVQTTGYYSLCAGLTTFTVGCPNTIMNGFTIFSQQLTSTQVQQVFAAYANDATNHGISFTPTPSPSVTPLLMGVGDSIMAGYNGTATWMSNMSLTNQQAYTIQNYGIGGVMMLAETSAEPWRIAPYCSSQQSPAVVLFEGGTNDIAELSSYTAQQIWGLTVATAKILKKAGCTIGYSPIISRVGNATNGSGTIEAFRATYNAIVRANWSTAFDFIFDWAANPYLGSSYAYNSGTMLTTCTSNSTYFNTDCIHPTAAGDVLITTATANSLNYYFATNGSWGNPLVLTATQTITLASGNRYVDATACTACTITLPDGVGPTGGTYNIMVGTGTVTVQGQTLYGQTQSVTGNGTVNGTGAVTLPTGKISTLTVYALPQATSGVKWVF